VADIDGKLLKRNSVMKFQTFAIKGGSRVSFDQEHLIMKINYQRRDEPIETRIASIKNYSRSKRKSILLSSSNSSDLSASTLVSNQSNSNASELTSISPFIDSPSAAMDLFTKDVDFNSLFQDRINDFQDIRHRDEVERIEEELDSMADEDRLSTAIETGAWTIEKQTESIRKDSLNLDMSQKNISLNGNRRRNSMLILDRLKSPLGIGEGYSKRSNSPSRCSLSPSRMVGRVYESLIPLEVVASQLSPVACSSR